MRSRTTRRIAHGYGALARSDLPLDTVELARHLIRKILVRSTSKGFLSGRIVETEAYPVCDTAGHACRGATAQNHALFSVAATPMSISLLARLTMLNVSSEAAGVRAGTGTAQRDRDDTAKSARPEPD